MFVETVEPQIQDGELVSLRVRMGDRRVIDFKRMRVELGYFILLSMGGKLYPLITNNPRARKYDPRWLDSLEFKLQLEGLGIHVVYGGSWHMSAYGMYPMGNKPMAIKWLISINKMESTISSFSLDIDVLPDVTRKILYGKKLEMALKMFPKAPFDDFIEMQVNAYTISDFLTGTGSCDVINRKVDAGT